MDLQFQRSEVTTNDCSIVVGNNAEKPGSAAVAMPVVREQAPRDRCGAVSITGPAPAAQEAAAKRAQDAETGLLEMPDDVLLLILAALDTAAPMTDVRDLEWLRACCKDLQKRVAAPLPAVVLELKYQASGKKIHAAMSDKLLDGQQVQAQVRALCDRYGDVRVSLHNLAGALPASPYLRYRNLNALAGMAESRNMRSLFLCLEGARDVTIKALCNALNQTAPTRVSLTVRGMKWGNVAVAKLLDKVGQSASIVSLAIDGSRGISSSSFRFMEQGGWAPKSAQSLGSMLRTNRSLETLDLSRMHPGEAAVEEIARSLAVNRSLMHLRLVDNDLSEKSIQHLGHALGSNVGLATLNLDGNRLGPRGVQGLLAGLRKNRTLTDLSLSRCAPGDAGALELIRVFEHNDTLRRLDLGHAEITGPVVARLTRLLQAGQHLATLDLPGNPIGSEGALAIGALLASDTMLASLDLSGCSIGNDALLLLAQGLRKNTRLRHLGLGMNHDLTSTGISALASALKAHQRIASLNLRGLSINSVGVQALADGLLANHPTLELLDLSDCVIGPKGIRILVGAMQTNTRLKKLVMDKRAHWSEPGHSD